MLQDVAGCCDGVCCSGLRLAIDFLYQYDVCDIFCLSLITYTVIISHFFMARRKAGKYDTSPNPVFRQRKTHERAREECAPEFQEAWKKVIRATRAGDRNALSEMQALTEWAVHAGELGDAIKAVSARLPYEAVKKSGAESETDARAKRIAELRAQIAALEDGDCDDV